MTGLFKSTRITPLPALLTLTSDKTDATLNHFHNDVSNILADDLIECVSMVCYRTNLSALKRLNILKSRKKTRLLLVPPDGITHEEALEIQKLSLPGLEVRQVDRNCVAEIIHYKLLLLDRSDGKSFAIVGSSNFTEKGTSSDPNIYPNAELSVLFEMKPNCLYKTIFEPLWEHSSPLLSNHFVSRPLDKILYTPLLVMLPYQNEVYNDIVAAYKNKESGVLLSLPTGAGKTVVAVRFLLDYVLTSESARVLWLAPHVELLYQAHSTFEYCRPFFRYEHLEFLPPDYDKEDILEENRHVDFLTTSAAHLGKVTQDEYDIVVVDEAHYGASYEAERLPKIREMYDKSFFLGLTGTPFRKKVSEQTHILRLFGKPVHKDKEQINKVTDAYGRSILAQIKNLKIETGYKIQLDESSLEAYEWERKDLRQFNNPQRNNSISSAWNKEMGTTLVFAVSIDHSHELAKAFQRNHPDVSIQVVHGSPIPMSVPSKIHPREGYPLTSHQRERILRLVRQGEITCLISVDVYTMGVDFPNVKTLFMARPTLSPIRYMQMIGRGLRGPAFGGTEYVNVVDFADQVETHEILSGRIMNYVRADKWEDERGKRIRLLGRLLERMQHNKPTSTRGKMDGKSGLYCAVTAGGNLIKGRHWKWVPDVGYIIGKGIREGSIKYTDVVYYIKENNDEMADKALKLLRIADIENLYDDLYSK